MPSDLSELVPIGLFLVFAAIITVLAAINAPKRRK